MTRRHFISGIAGIVISRKAPAFLLGAVQETSRNDRFSYLDYVYNNGVPPSSVSDDGRGAYVDTYWVPDRRIDLHCSFKMLTRPTANRSAVFGELHQDVFNSRSSCLQVYSGLGRYQFISEREGTSLIQAISSDRIDVDIVDSKDLTMTTNNSVRRSTCEFTTNGVGPLYYGCTYYKGSNGPVWHGCFNLGRLSIVDHVSGAKLVDLIPCRDQTTGLYGFFDNVHGTFVGSSNGVQFGAERN